MKEFVAACAQFAVKPNDIEGNSLKAAEWLEAAVKTHGAELVVFPETITTGFVPKLSISELYDLVDHIPGKTTERMQKEAKKFKAHVVWSTYERGEENIIYNTTVLIGSEGDVLGTYRKVHPFPTERVDLGGWTTRGDETVVCDTELGKIGLICCYDGDFPELSRVIALKGAEVIVRPSAFLRTFHIWQLTNLARAYDNHVYMVATNAVGPDAGMNYYYGHSMIVSPTAQILAQARGTEEMVAARLDPEPLRNLGCGSAVPMVFNHMEDRWPKAYEGILEEGKSTFPRHQ
ncbi:MAG TPA: carbon-nitrogen hydrolase family protein [Chroococcales cyanobacterium]|jgi:predicted amidohydrolase